MEVTLAKSATSLVGQMQKWAYAPRKMGASRQSGCSCGSASTPAPPGAFRDRPMGKSDTWFDQCRSAWERRSPHRVMIVFECAQSVAGLIARWNAMDSIIYLVGLIVVAMFILSVLGLR
jgi:hypothetical protein